MIRHLIAATGEDVPHDMAERIVNLTVHPKPTGLESP